MTRHLHIFAFAACIAVAGCGGDYSDMWQPEARVTIPPAEFDHAPPANVVVHYVDKGWWQINAVCGGRNYSKPIIRTGALYTGETVASPRAAECASFNPQDQSFTCTLPTPDPGHAVFDMDHTGVTQEQHDRSREHCWGHINKKLSGDPNWQSDDGYRFKK